MQFSVSTEPSWVVESLWCFPASAVDGQQVELWFSFDSSVISFLLVKGLHSDFPFSCQLAHYEYFLHLFQDSLNIWGKFLIGDNSDMAFNNPSILGNKYCRWNSFNPQHSCNPVFPSNWKGHLVGLHELLNLIILASNKDTQEKYTFFPMGQISILKWRSLSLALWSPMWADVNYHRHPLQCFRFDSFSIKGLLCESPYGIICIQHIYKKHTANDDHDKTNSCFCH